MSYCQLLRPIILFLFAVLYILTIYTNIAQFSQRCSTRSAFSSSSLIRLCTLITNNFHLFGGGGGGCGVGGSGEWLNFPVFSSIFWGEGKKQVMTLHRLTHTPSSLSAHLTLPAVAFPTCHRSKSSNSHF